MSNWEMQYLDGAKRLPLKTGEDYSLEEQAALLLAQGRQGVTALADKRDYLTKDQLQLRAQREILNNNGVSDESLFSGLFRRAFNPLAHSRPTGRASHHDD